MKEVGRRFLNELPDVVEATLVALDERVPAIGAAIDRDVLRAAITVTNLRVAEHMQGTPSSAATGTHVAFGTVVARAGVPLEQLDTAYRLGARLAWRVATRIARDLEVDPDVAFALAELHVAYVDRLAAESLEGYGAASAAAGAALARERQVLLEALLDGAGDVVAASASARWSPLPDRVRAGVLLRRTDRDARALPAEALVGRHAGAAVLVVSGLTTLDPGLAVALGPVVALDRVAESLAAASRIAALAEAGHLPRDRCLCWEEHLAAVVLHTDRASGEALVARRLAPLAEVPPARRRLLEETLAAWLAWPGQPLAMSRDLHLHRQTVRYRLGRLRERFGDALDDPGARFELGLALALRPPTGNADE